MAKCVEKLPHRTDKCNSSDGLQVFLEDGKYTGFCFSCGTYVPNPYSDKPVDYKPNIHIKSQQEIDEEIEEISEYGCVDLPDRKLKKEYLEYFGVKIGVSPQDGVTPHSHYYPYYKDGKIVAYKARMIEGKKFWGIGNLKEAGLFGWEQAVSTGAKRIIITEGELDAVALFQICKEHNKGTQYAGLNPAIVSLPNGSSAALRDISRVIADIRKTFKEIVLAFDQDDPGKKAAESVVKNFPDILVANLPAKDANDCLVQGRSKAAYNAVIFNSSRPKNTRLVDGKTLHESAKIPPTFGVSWPWEHVTKATRGIRLGETIYIGAG